ncbi:hypothetical protein ONZ45_g9698 [Pleurotus djamor]|nr:hypothetical protein ONZ45_g9698 [Pleurotus djamor]
MSEPNWSKMLEDGLSVFFDNPVDFHRQIVTTKSLIGGSFAATVFRGEEVQSSSDTLEVFADNDQGQSLNEWLLGEGKMRCYRGVIRVGLNPSTWQSEEGLRTGEAPMCADVDKNKFIVAAFTYRGQRGQFVRLCLGVGDPSRLVLSGFYTYFNGGQVISLYPSLAKARTIVVFDSRREEAVQQWQARGWDVAASVPEGHIDVGRWIDDRLTFHANINIGGMDEGALEAARWESNVSWRVVNDRDGKPHLHID